jgi:hypothetical protein
MFVYLTLESAWTHGDISQYVVYKNLYRALRSECWSGFTTLRVFIGVHIIDQNEHSAHANCLVGSFV